MAQDDTDTRGSSGDPDRDTHSAGAFDVRRIIAALIGGYGVVLILMGIFSTSDTDLARAGGLNVNLYAGIGMAVFAGSFLLWVRMRPLVVPNSQPQEKNTS